MKLKYRVQNCLAFGRKPVEVDLTQPGLTLIQGKHLSSKTKSTNGVGKSSVFNTAFWIFYGKYPKGYSKADMLNEATMKNCLGEGWITKGNKTGYIVRGISCKEMTFNEITVQGDFLLFFIDGKDMRGATQTDTQEAIEAFLGLDYDSFITAALFTVDEDSFSSKTSGKQEEIFSKLLHLEDLEIARRRVKDKQKEVKSEVSSCEQLIEKYQSHISREKARLSQVKESLEEWKAQQKQKQERLEQKLEAKEIEIERLHQQVEDVESNILEETKNLKELEAKAEKVDSDKLTEQRLSLSAEIREGDTSIGGIQNDIARLNKDIRQAQSMRGTAVCDKCFSTVDGEHLYKVLTEKNQELETKQVEYEGLKKTQVELQSRLQKVDSELRKLDALRNDVVRQRAKVDRLHNEKKSLVSSIASCEDTLEELEEQIDAVQSEKPPLSEDAESIKQEIGKLNTKIETTQAQKSSYLTELEDLDFCEKMFGPQGIRNLLVRSVIPKLNEQANRFAEVLTDGELTIEFQGETQVGTGKRTESRNKLDVKVYDRYGSEKYAKESGGEKRRVDICVSLALNYLVASRIGLPFAGFDEFYASLDRRGEMKVMDLLENLKADIPSIFVISNNESISSSEFDNVWTVCRKGKESWIEY